MEYSDGLSLADLQVFVRLIVCDQLGSCWLGKQTHQLRDLETNLVEVQHLLCVLLYSLRFSCHLVFRSWRGIFSLQSIFVHFICKVQPRHNTDRQSPRSKMLCLLASLPNYYKNKAVILSLFGSVCRDEENACVGLHSRGEGGFGDVQCRGEQEERAEDSFRHAEIGATDYWRIERGWQWRGGVRMISDSLQLFCHASDLYIV